MLSDFNNIQESCIHTKFAQSVLLWKLFNSFSESLQWKILCEHDHHYPKARLSWSRLARMRNSIVLPQRGFTLSTMKRFKIFTHFCDCSVKTELIYRNDCAENCFNRIQIGTIVYRQFSTAFALELTSGQWTRGTEDWVFAFCEFQHQSSLPCCPIHLVDYLHW